MHRIFETKSNVNKAPVQRTSQGVHIVSEQFDTVTDPKIKSKDKSKNYRWFESCLVSRYNVNRGPISAYCVTESKWNRHNVNMVRKPLVRVNLKRKTIHIKFLCEFFLKPLNNRISQVCNPS